MQLGQATAAIVKACLDVYKAARMVCSVLLRLVVLENTSTETEIPKLPSAGEQPDFERSIFEQIPAFGGLLALLDGNLQTVLPSCSHARSCKVGTQLLQCSI